MLNILEEIAGQASRKGEGKWGKEVLNWEGRGREDRCITLRIFAKRRETYYSICLHKNGVTPHEEYT